MTTAGANGRVGRSLKDGYRRAISGDPEFGHICPTCAGPKSDQALRCRRCMADQQVVHGLFRKGVMRGQTFRHSAHVVNYHGPGT